MSIILGIDIGGSTTKIVGLQSGGTTIAMHRVQAQDPISSMAMPHSATTTPSATA